MTTISVVLGVTCFCALKSDLVGEEGTHTIYTIPKMNGWSSTFRLWLWSLTLHFSTSSDRVEFKWLVTAPEAGSLMQLDVVARE